MAPRVTFLIERQDLRKKEINHPSNSDIGPRSSPLVGGYSTLHRDLETQLACLKGTEEALLFPSGFAANQV